MKDLGYEVIGLVDADISFDKEYFLFLLGKLVGDPKLGLVGTPFQESSRPAYDYRFVSIEHVSGCCQLFRRECFEDIGGYGAVKKGGIENIDGINGRKERWKR